MARIFQRGQNALRSFLGLGPSQLFAEDFVLPTLDLDFLLRTPQDSIQRTTTVGGIAPGAASVCSLSPPGRGIYLLDSISWETAGPATSGSWRAFPHISRTGVVWGRVTSLGLDNRMDSYPRIAGQNVIMGVVMPNAVLMYHDGVNLDSINVTFFNDAASVGNMSMTAYASLRPLEPVLV